MSQDNITEQPQHGESFQEQIAPDKANIPVTKSEADKTAQDEPSAENVGVNPDQAQTESRVEEAGKDQIKEGTEGEVKKAKPRMTLKEKYHGVIETFLREMPSPETELDYRNPYELLVAVVLSAQCTDKRINMITPAFFEKYPNATELAKASFDDIHEFIKSVTFPNNKTKALMGLAQTLVEKYGGEVPSDIESLLTLPGVGRKSANVILNVIYGEAVMPVDTHVFRVSERLGLTTKSPNPATTEKVLMKHIPEEHVQQAHHWLILHGRYVCKARKPECEECYLKQYCRMFKEQSKKMAAEALKKDAQKNKEQAKGKAKDAKKDSQKRSKKASVKKEMSKEPKKAPVNEPKQNATENISIKNEE